MQVRKNVRERRKNRILQLSRRLDEEGTDAREAEIRTTANLIPSQGARHEPKPAAEAANSPDATGSLDALDRYLEQDPEKWWKERQRLQFSNPVRGGSEAERGAGGIGSIKRLSDFPNLAGSGGSGWREGPSYPEAGGTLGRFLRSLLLRTAVAALLLGAGWVWFRLELPGSGQAQAWTAQAVTRDMNYIAVQEWYEKTFGSAPAFLELLNRPDSSEAVSADWGKEDIAVPLVGTIVKTFGQDGAGIRMTAPAGSPIRAVHAGRVTQVTTDAHGVATVLIQHPNRIVSVYGGLDRVDVKANDWVETGAAIGELAAGDGGAEEGSFYFALQQNGQSLDPSEVIPFD
ncbi:M23 family metallopeptidase [Cohnella fermenti]|uniref:M23 family metallopeptidase n=1 Tax=Cohnella fermenti TaxID=2565925 RepID=A0A4V3WGD2_9BACL|nr:M23 family metallopeptidase [Cohnella fermenti]THF83803.1 M23 family metallopeptidase [Cohnella fermenti]